MTGRAVLRKAIFPFDLPDVLEGAAAFARALDAPDIVADPGSQAFDAAVTRVLYLPGVSVILADLSPGDVAGGIGFMISPYLWNPARLSIEEVFWWVRPGAPARVAMQLLRAMVAAGDAAGATIRSFSALHNSPPGVAKAYRHFGLRAIQTTFLGSTA